MCQHCDTRDICESRKQEPLQLQGKEAETRKGV